MVSANMSMQGVTVTPRFIFGANGGLNGCLHMHEEKQLVYVAGHNVIIYNMDECQQQFIPGSENIDEINFITLSPSGRYIALCERENQQKENPRGQVTIYEIAARKKRKTLPDWDAENLQF